MSRSTSITPARAVHLFKSRAVGLTSGIAQGLVSHEVDVEVEIGTVGDAYETLVKRQGLAMHKRAGKIDLGWFHTLHKRWRHACNATT